jgi:hypothetical protein
MGSRVLTRWGLRQQRVGGKPCRAAGPCRGVPHLILSKQLHVLLLDFLEVALARGHLCLQLQHLPPNLNLSRGKGQPV